MALLPALRQTRRTVSTVASIQSFTAPAGSAAYSVSKGALAQFTRADPDRLARVLARVPLGRVGHPSEPAGPVVFLASNGASDVTGAILPVDGGDLAV